jgi:hypothetical protein
VSNITWQWLLVDGNIYLLDMSNGKRHVVWEVK